MSEQELRAAVGNVIRANGWTRSSTAKRAGLYRSELNGWLTGDRGIKAGRLLKLLEAVGGSVVVKA